MAFFSTGRGWSISKCIALLYVGKAGLGRNISSYPIICSVANVQLLARKAFTNPLPAASVEELLGAFRVFISVS